MEYLIVPHKEVNAYLDDGWQLYGNPLAESTIIWQALTRVKQ